jgi:transposase InsO family protein
VNGRRRPRNLSQGSWAYDATREAESSTFISPRYNGPEFISTALDRWAFEHGVALDFIQPGKPTQNAQVESFNGHFRDESLAQAVTVSDPASFCDQRSGPLPEVRASRTSARARGSPTRRSCQTPFTGRLLIFHSNISPITHQAIISAHSVRLNGGSAVWWLRSNALD